MAIIIGNSPEWIAVNPQGIRLGGAGLGGHVICKNGGVLWIVAPYCTEVGRTWYNTSDATTLAEAGAACGDWFIPTVTQLQNPGCACREYWGGNSEYSPSAYWSSSPGGPPSRGGYVVFPGGGGTPVAYKSITWCARAFRCVSY